MFTDFRQSDAPTSIRCHICIVGAGAAGITLALALADSGLDVCVVESGGFEFDDATQALCDGERAGMENANPLGCRVRYLGGTTNQWMGWCSPLHDNDFAERPWIPHSGWPINKRDLDPYYARAWALCEVQPEGEAAAFAALPHFDPDKIQVGFWYYSPPTRFGTTYREQLADAPRVNVLLNCNAVRIETDAGGSEVRRLDVAALNGKTGSIISDAYVLACGGMENTRLLLLADDVEPAGLGNRSGTLGRFFAQHIEVVSAQVHASDPARMLELLDPHGRHTVRAHLTTAPGTQRASGLLNTAFSFGNPQQYSSGYLALHDLWKAVASGNWPDDFGEKVRSVAADLDSVAEDVFVTRRRGPPYLNLEVYAEQTPSPDSRITLGATKDPFGLRRIRVDWRLCTADRRSIVQSTQKLAEELGRMKIGRVRLAEWLSDDAAWPQPIWGGCHHMGTTRMSHDADSGVVNSDCRLHEVHNLYVAGSSVFPTGGYVPPTLTIVAMALRLADHLAQRHA